MELDGYKRLSEARVGDVFTRPLFVRDISEIKKDGGSTHLLFTFLDGESEEKAMLFSTTLKQARDMGAAKHCVLNVTIKVTDYRGKSFNVEKIEPLSDPDVKPEDFIMHPPVDVKVMFDEIIGMLKASSDDMGGSVTPLSELAVSILEENKKNFLRSSAAVSVHHNFMGGLIYHSYRMFKAADAICSVYSELDKELLLCAAAIHDVGKIWEYHTDGMGDAEYTMSGVLFGHIYMGASLISKQAEKLKAEKEYSFNDEKLKLLTHMILSHHGTLEWGAVVPPAIPEAFALHYLDNLDAKLNVCDKEYKKLAAGSVTQAKPFTFDGRIYKPKYKNDDK